MSAGQVQGSVTSLWIFAVDEVLPVSEEQYLGIVSNNPTQYYDCVQLCSIL